MKRITTLAAALVLAAGIVSFAPATAEAARHHPRPPACVALHIGGKRVMPAGCGWGPPITLSRAEVCLQIARLRAHAGIPGMPASCSPRRTGTPLR